jgi:hypothetical protein
MPTIDQDRFRSAIRKTLTQRARGAPAAHAVAAAAAGTCREILARLAPVVGRQGVEVLFDRSLHLTSAAFPWLAPAGDEASPAALARVEASLASSGPDAAAAASETLLVTFVTLLATLIGESLTERLLRPVWAPSTPSSKEETGS